MYNPFPVPDQRFVKQFINARGPEAVLERLESRTGLQDTTQNPHSLEFKEVSIVIQYHYIHILMYRGGGVGGGGG
jgi:hypothetical protein